jgi:hypothetical protein
MYFWKCWRDARRGIVAYVAALAFSALIWVVPFGHRAGIPTPTDESRMVFSWSFLCAWGLAIAFGAMGPGVDIGDGLGAFLLTRPRSRAHFAWVAWAAG